MIQNSCRRFTRSTSDTSCGKPFGGKNIDVLCDLFADSILTGKRNPRLPLMYDSTIASEYAWKFLQDARMNDLPAIGNLQTLEQIRERRKT